MNEHPQGYGSSPWGVAGFPHPRGRPDASLAAPTYHQPTEDVRMHAPLPVLDQHKPCILVLYYDIGWGMREIAARYGCSRSFVSKKFGQWGWAARRPGPAGIAKARRFNRKAALGAARVFREAR